MMGKLNLTGPEILVYYKLKAIINMEKASGSALKFR